MAFTTMPKYLFKEGGSYRLQRAVPKDVRGVIGKATWKASAGRTYTEALRRVAPFLEKTDAAIASARSRINVTTEETIELIPELSGISKEDLIAAIQMLGLKGVDAFTPQQEQRAIEVANKGSEGVYTIQQLLDDRKKEAPPADRTYIYWYDNLHSFMEFCQCQSPLSCTSAQAQQYADLLHSRYATGSVQQKLGYLKGLFQTLSRRHPGHPNIFASVTVAKKSKREQAALLYTRAKDSQCKPIAEWPNHKYVDIFKILYYTGARLAEICALRGEDLKDDRICIVWHDERPLKTISSQRDIPLHPELRSIVKKYQGIQGLIWPNLQIRTKHKSGTVRIQWGASLTKPSRDTTGISPKGFRDRMTDQLRNLDANEHVIKKILGHTASGTTEQFYGSEVWDKMVKVIESVT